MDVLAGGLVTVLVAGGGGISSEGLVAGPVPPSAVFAK